MRRIVIASIPLLFGASLLGPPDLRAQAAGAKERSREREQTSAPGKNGSSETKKGSREGKTPKHVRDPGGKRTRERRAPSRLGKLGAGSDGGTAGAIPVKPRR